MNPHRLTPDVRPATYKSRDWLLTGFQTLKGVQPTSALKSSSVRYSATCTGASAAAGQFCAAVAAGTTGPCAGDAGSPLVYNTDASGTAPATVAAAAYAKDVLAGVSTGVATCGKANAPAVFTSVGGTLKAWITNNLAAYPSPCWTRFANLTHLAVVGVGGPPKQVFKPPPGVRVSPGDYKKVEAARAVSQCMEDCRLRELYAGGCKAFSVYSGVNVVSGRRLLGVLDPPAASFCVFYRDQVPELCGADASGHCGKAVTAWRMTWTGA